jgi:hypothetical protein
LLQRQVESEEEEEEEEEEMIQAKPLAGQITPLVQRQVESEEDEEEEEPILAKSIGDAQVQRQEEEPEEEEEEMIQAKPLAGQITPLLQRQVEPEEEDEEEEEAIQAKPLAAQITPLVQRQVDPEEEEEEEALQTKPLTSQITSIIQRQVEPEEEEETLQTKSIGSRIAPGIQRQAELEEEEEETVQAKLIPGRSYREGRELAARIRSLQGRGQPLPAVTRSFFEGCLGYDFSGVCVHTNADAADAARAVQARAFTSGRDIVFGAGQYAPATERGRQLIAHELVHVTQQRAASRGAGLRRKPILGLSDDLYEREADRIAAKVTGASASSSERSGKASIGKRDVEGNVGELASGGSFLPESLRTYYEKRFRRDLGSVRVHTGPRAERQTQAIKAQAFTYDTHIWLGKGQRVEPSFVLAHELTHVIQQHQPAVLEVEKGEHQQDAEPTSSASQTTLSIQRLPFWVPVSKKARWKIMAGRGIHKEILSAVEGKEGIDVEAPVPNAIREYTGLGLQGYADLYKASTGSRIGIYFGGPRGVACGDYHYEPKKTKGAGKLPKPRLEKGDIKDIKGPTWIRIGELKPAALEELEKGEEQLQNYESGFKCAQKLTNEWARAHGDNDRWKLEEVTRLTFKVPDHYKWDPNRPKDDLELTVADIDIAKDERRKYVVKEKPEFRALRARLGKRIPGGLYVEPYGNGLWTYFARPANFEKALDLPPRYKRKDMQEVMKVARDIQNDVIDVLKGSKIVRLKARSDGDGSHSDGSQIHLPITAENPSLVLRRKKKKITKLKDNFRSLYKRWAKRQKQLGDIVRGPKKKWMLKRRPPKKSIEYLRFLELAYEAEQGLQQAIPNKRRADFPKKSDLIVKIKSGKGKAKKVTEKSLAKMYSWMKFWTSRPVRVLGRFRKRFGVILVNVTEKFSTLGQAIKKKLKTLFEKKSASKLNKGGYLAIAVRALGRAIKAIADLLLPHTFRLVAKSFADGLKEKFEKILSLRLEPLQDFVRELTDEPKKKLNELTKIVKDLGESKEVKFVRDMVKKFEPLAALKELLDKSDTVATIVKWGMVALNCVTPPGWGCLKVLAKKLVKRVVDEILKICPVQRAVACIVMKIKFFKNIPTSLAKDITEWLDGKLGNIHPELKGVFKPIESEKLPNCNEVECKEEKPATDKQKAVVALQERLGPKKFKALVDLIEKVGVPEGAPLSADEITDLGNRVEKMNVTELEKLAKSYPRTPTGTEKLVNLVTLLETAKKRAVPRLIEDLQAGKYDVFFKEPYGTCDRSYCIRKPGDAIIPNLANVKKGQVMSGRLFLMMDSDKEKYAGFCSFRVKKVYKKASKAEFVFTEDVKLVSAKDTEITPLKKGQRVRWNLHES